MSSCVLRSIDVYSCIAADGNGLSESCVWRDVQSHEIVDALEQTDEKTLSILESRFKALPSAMGRRTVPAPVRSSRRRACAPSPSAEGRAMSSRF